MARSGGRNWTTPELRELEKAFKALTPRQLAERYAMAYEDLLRVHEFAVAHRRLKISQKTVTQHRDGKPRKYLVTVYAAGYAKGIITHHIEEDQES